MNPRIEQRNDLAADLDAFLARHEDELIEFRRDLHAHPELGQRRAPHHPPGRAAPGRGGPAAGDPAQGHRPDGRHRHAGRAGRLHRPPVVALRADLDALPMTDEKDVPYRSTVPNACHACGHDVHTTVLLGTGLYLADQAAAGSLPGRVRLDLPARRGGRQRRPRRARGGRHRLGRPDLRPALRPPAGRRRARRALRCDHGRLRPDPGPGVRARRPHGPAAPDRGPGVRARQDHHRGARRAVPAGRPPVQPEPGLGPGQRRDRGQRDPRRRDRRGHRPLPRRRGLAPRARPAQGPHRLGGVRLRGQHRAHLPRATCRPRSTTRAARPCSRPRRSTCSARARSCRPRRASAARTSPGTWSRSPARWPGWAPGCPVRPRRWTSTSPPSTWTNAPSAVGVKVMAATAINALWDDGAMVAQPLPGVTGA